MTDIDWELLMQDPDSCGYKQHNPPGAIALSPGLWFWRCHACKLIRLLPVFNVPLA